MKSKKGAIELSMTTIIVIILGVVLLSFGLLFVRGVFTKITTLSDKAFLVADNEIQTKMGGDEKFFVGGTDITLKSGKSITINTGIRNIGAGSTSFKIKGNCECSIVTIITSDKVKTIEEGDKGGIPIIIKLDKTADPGEICTCSIQAFKGTTPYADEIIVVTAE